MTEAEYRKLKAEHDRVRQEADEARGALKSLREQLKRDHGLDSVEKAQARVKELTRETSSLEKALDAAVAAYRKEFPE